MPRISATMCKCGKQQQKIKQQKKHGVNYVSRQKPKIGCFYQNEPNCNIQMKYN